MKYLKPTVRIQRRRPLEPVLVSILAVRESIEGSGIYDEVCYLVLGCNASPVWVSVASLRPYIKEAEIL